MELAINVAQSILAVCGTLFVVGMVANYIKCEKIIKVIYPAIPALQSLIENGIYVNLTGTMKKIPREDELRNMLLFHLKSFYGKYLGAGGWVDLITEGLKSIGVFPNRCGTSTNDLWERFKKYGVSSDSDIKPGCLAFYGNPVVNEEDSTWPGVDFTVEHIGVCLDSEFIIEARTATRVRIRPIDYRPDRFMVVDPIQLKYFIGKFGFKEEKTMTLKIPEKKDYSHVSISVKKK